MATMKTTNLVIEENKIGDRPTLAVATASLSFDGAQDAQSHHQEISAAPRTIVTVPAQRPILQHLHYYNQGLKSSMEEKN